MSGLLNRLAVLVASVVVALLLAEGSLRLMGFEYVPIDIQVSAELGGAGFRAYHVFEDDNFTYDPLLIWRPKPGYGVFNRQGFRGPDAAIPKPPGVFRVLTIGDSNTLGWAGIEGSNWPQSLGRLIGSGPLEVEVLNAGIWGYSSFQGVRRLREMIGYEPDLVFVSFGSNDAHRVLRSDEDYASTPVRATDSGRLLGRFRIGQLVLAALDRPGPRPSPDDLDARVSLEEYRANLRLMVGEAQDAGADVVLLTRPYARQTNSPYYWKNWGPDYNAATIEVAEDLDVIVVDIYSFFKGREELFADDAHFTDDGHRLAAEIILDHIRPLIPTG